MAGAFDGMPQFIEGRDYTLSEKGVLKVKDGHWKVEAEEGFVHVYHGSMKMLGFDVNGFNSLLNTLIKFSAVAMQLRDERDKGKPRAVAPQKH